MPVIKRYPNRKLYDTEAKQYITLDEIAGLIREGQEVSVIDHATGEDLTAVTLTQIIFEQEKKRKGFLPQTVLTGLIQAGGDTMGTLRRTMATSLDLARQVDEEIEQRVQALINRGELAAGEGRRLREKLIKKDTEPADAALPSEQELERMLSERGVPTQNDLKQILEQLDVLTSKLNEITSDSEPA
jgi:polyhydroxyalkanoate synthesis repressor PhaR